MKFVSSEIIKKVAAQVLGSEYMNEVGNIAELDSAGLVDLGKKIEATADGSNVNYGVDLALRTILDEGGRIVFESKKYMGTLKEMFIDSRDFGGYLVRYYFNPVNVMTPSEMWNGDGFVDYFEVGGKESALRTAEIEHGYYKPNVDGRYFNEAFSHSIPVSVIREQFTVTFTSWSKIDEFLSAVMTSIENTATILSEARAHALLCTGIGAAAVNGNVINLLSEYKTINSGTALTAANAMYDKDFLTYCMQRVAEIKDEMKLYTSAYSNGENFSFTDDEDFRLFLNSQFANKVKMSLRANTFNEKLLGVGDYTKVTSWQAFAASGKKVFDWETVTTVMLSAESIKKVSEGEQNQAMTVSGIIGMAFDRRALGICLKKQKVTQNYIGSKDMWNNWFNILISQILDTNFKIVVFTISDTDPVVMQTKQSRLVK